MAISRHKMLSKSVTAAAAIHGEREVILQIERILKALIRIFGEALGNHPPQRRMQIQRCRFTLQDRRDDARR